MRKIAYPACGFEIAQHQLDLSLRSIGAGLPWGKGEKIGFVWVRFFGQHKGVFVRNFFLCSSLCSFWVF